MSSDMGLMLNTNIVRLIVVYE